MMMLKNMQRYQKLANYSFSTVSQRTNYYTILGVANTASQKEILEAYTRQAQQFFPTVNTTDLFISNQQGENYRSVAEAYAVLSNLESRNNYDLLDKRQPDRIYKQTRDQQQSALKRDSTGHVPRKPYPQGSFAEERHNVLSEERSKFNVDFLGRYKGGLPQKGKGIVRGSSLGPPGAHHDVLAHTEKTEQHPDHQNVTNELAQQFSDYQQQSSYLQQRRWPGYQAKVEHDYFKFAHYQMALRYFRNILIFFFGIPGFAILVSKWRNTFSLYSFKKLNTLNPDVTSIQSFGRKVVVGKYGAIKYE